MKTPWLGVIPGAMSMFRVLAGVAYPWLPVDWRLAVVSLAALSDLLDGPTSRWLKVDGKFGRFLDPFADKIFLLCVLLTTVLEGDLAWWEMALVGARDLAVFFACVVIALRGGWEPWQKMKPRHLGKMTTAVQIAFLLAFLAGADALARVLVIAAGVLGITAFLDYVLAFRSTQEGSNR